MATVDELGATPQGDFSDLLGAALGAALQEKGFTELTQVQKAVLDPALQGRDLRITSQTGSGKTVAIGFVIRDLASQPSALKDKLAHPRALVIVPTRELAKQVVQELTWLFAPLSARVASVTGGAVYRDELRALASAPFVVVGTPGRMLDHLNRGSIVPAEVAAVVLDEADRMLDLGFREELEAILATTPSERRTHLVSATFPRDVEALANSVQKNPARVEGTRLGVANVDIDHVIHVVEPRQRLDSVINLLLASPEAQTLIFARTRADVADVAERLSEAGFAVNALSGEMDQRERDRALSAFRRADQRVLVATDVAARGIDVQDITLVIHLDPPTDPDSYTHRSGRTGRAGRKGRSVLLVSPSAMGKTSMLLKRAKVSARTEPVPSAQEIRKNGDQRLFERLTRADDDQPAASLDRQRELADRLAGRDDNARTISRLLSMLRVAGPTEPREIRRAESSQARKLPRDSGRSEREPTRGAAPRVPVERADRGRAGAPQRGASNSSPSNSSASNSSASNSSASNSSADWVSFRVTWGGDHGADARKLLAMVCRWGEIRGSDVGAIEIDSDSSRISVKASVAAGFAEATQKPDARNPRVTIREEQRAGWVEHPQIDAGSPTPRAAAPGSPKKFTDPARPSFADRSPSRGSAREGSAREGSAREGSATREPKSPSGATREVAPREYQRPREAALRRDSHASRAPGGFPREASRPRVVTGYPRDAKRSRERARDGSAPQSSARDRPRDGSAPQSSAREAARAPIASRGATRSNDAQLPHDGEKPPRRRRVVTR